MASDLEKALARAHYTALPLPRGKSEPTTIFSFSDGQLYVVRNAHTCLPDPPLSVTTDPAVDTLEFSREYRLEMKGIVGFFTRLFGLGNLKAELETRCISSATVQMGGLAHKTIETGALIDYLLQQKPTTCMRDVLDRDNFIVLAALHASTFTYTFRNSKGAVVRLSGPEASGLFKLDGTVNVQVGGEGRIVVSAPAYVGVVTWDGRRISKELEKAKRQTMRKGVRPWRPAGAVENAVPAQELRKRRLASLGVRR